MKNKKQIKVNNLRTKALHWWGFMSPEMKKTMIHNPYVNKSDLRPRIDIVDRNEFRIQNFFENWLKWEIEDDIEICKPCYRKKVVCNC